MQKVGEQKVFIGERGNIYPQNPVYPHLFPPLFPRFGVAVNSSRCRLLHCKLLIFQRKRPLTISS
jgi:hypothetical protein